MERKKYPKTYHFEFSKGLQNDDRKLTTIENFQGKQCITTLKMDGENTTMTKDFIHARSLDSLDHPSRHWTKGLWGTIKHNIPENMYICGENVYAKHSIFYENLKSYFFVFNIWIDDLCLSLNETLEYCNLLGLEFVPILDISEFNYDKIKNIYETLDFNMCEGIVTRVTDSFDRKLFQTHCAKAVRSGHVQTDKHWINQPITPNKLSNE
jgi:hypothetical protein